MTTKIESQLTHYINIDSIEAEDVDIPVDLTENLSSFWKKFVK